jgi:hypothetical protein
MYAIFAQNPNILETGQHPGVGHEKSGATNLQDLFRTSCYERLRGLAPGRIPLFMCYGIELVWVNTHSEGPNI